MLEYASREDAGEGESADVVDTPINLADVDMLNNWVDAENFQYRIAGAKLYASGECDELRRFLGSCVPDA